MYIIEDLIGALFIPLWPFGIVIPIISTVILFYTRRSLIQPTPFICTAVWFVVRVILIWDVLWDAFITFLFPNRHVEDSLGLGFSLELFIIMGTVGLTIIVLIFSVLSTWITHKILKKFNS